MDINSHMAPVVSNAGCSIQLFTKVLGFVTV